MTDVTRTEQPRSRSCIVCGTSNRLGLKATFFTTGPGRAEARVTYGDPHQGHPGLVHGGMLAMLLDEALGRAALVEHPTRYMVTARLSIEYLKPVPIGRELLVRAWIESDRRLLADAACEASFADGSVAARGRGMLVLSRPQLGAGESMG